ncbi:MAG TPA: VOC family protein [Acidimicrobiales bacterium]
MIDTTGVHHVALNVRDLDEALAFYTGPMGFTILPRPDFGIPGAWLQAGGSQVHLVAVPDGVPDDHFQHFALQVRDLDECIEALEAAAVTVERLRHTPGAGRQAFLHDPSGNRIELNQPEG